MAVENLQTRSLRCQDGLLTPFRGRALPWTSRELNDPALPPLEIPASLCHEVRFSSHLELERHYFHLAGDRGEGLPARSTERDAVDRPREAVEPPAPAANEADEDAGDEPELGRAFALTHEAALRAGGEREL